MDAVLAHGPRRARGRASAPRSHGARHPLRVGRRRRHLARRPDPARDPRRRVGRRSRPGSPSACARSTRSSPTSTASGGSSPRACCRSACSTRAEDLEPALLGVAAAPAASGSASPGSTSSATATGTWLVLEDNVRTPSGLGYWLAAREATLHRPRRRRPRRRRARSTASPDALRRVLGAGHAVVLTDGPDNAAYWEHALDRRAARHPAGRAGRPRGARRAGCCHAGDAGRRGLPAHERGRGRQRGGRACSSRSWRRAASSWSTASAPASPTTSSPTPTSTT